MERPSAPRSQNGASRAAGMGSAGGMDSTSGEAGRTRSRPLSSATVADRIKVAVVDAHPLYRHGLANAVAGSRVVVVAEGGTAEDARRAVQKGKPDILLMDTAVPGDGMGAAQAILRLRSGLKVVVL